MKQLVVYGKKPRKSKSSEIIEIEGLSFFLYNTKASTKGLTEIYLLLEPYPLINIAQSNEKAKLWISNNISQIKDKMLTMDLYELVSREEFMKKKPVEEVKEKHGITLEECQRLHQDVVLQKQDN